MNKPTGRSQQPSAHSPRRVADHGHGLDDRSGGHLTKGNGIEELGAGHPVVGVDGVMLHERNDHEPAAVGEGSHFERFPGHGAQSPYGDGMSDEDGNNGQRRTGRPRPQASPHTYLYGPAVHEDKDEKRTDGDRRGASRCGVEGPADLLRCL